MKKHPLTPAERKARQRERQKDALNWYTAKYFGANMSLDALATAIEKLYNEKGKTK